LKDLNELKPSEIKIAALLFKPGSFQHQWKFEIDYVGFEIPNDFVVGYGLDYKGKGRNLLDIYTEKPSE
jgi:hypoxanthine phosphoribosyltransferase